MNLINAFIQFVDKAKNTIVLEIPDLRSIELSLPDFKRPTLRSFLNIGKLRKIDNQMTTGRQSNVTEYSSSRAIIDDDVINIEQRLSLLNVEVDIVKDTIQFAERLNKTSIAQKERDRVLAKYQNHLTYLEDQVEMTLKLRDLEIIRMDLIQSHLMFIQTLEKEIVVLTEAIKRNGS